MFLTAIWIISEQSLNVYLHEIALHTHQNVDEFRFPFQTPVKNPHAIDPLHVTSNAHVEALRQCLSSCHSILETFLAMPFDERLVMPALFTIRSVYSIVCLVKMWVAVTNPNSNIHSMFRADDLKVEHYIDRFVDTYRAVADIAPRAPQANFFSVVSGLKERFRMIKEGGGRNADGSVHCSSNMQSGNQEERSSAPPSMQSGNQNGAAHTPLQLLSEVAMNNNSNGGNGSNPQSTMTSPYSQQQNTFGNIDPAFSNNNMPSDPALAAEGINSNYDFSNVDFNSLGMLNMDLNGLFGWDGYWSAIAMPPEINHSTAGNIGGMGAWQT
jgi:hypothetical protein